MNTIVTTMCVGAMAWVWWGMGVPNALNMILVYTWAIVLPGSMVIVFAGDERTWRSHDPRKIDAYYSWPFAIGELRNVAMGALLVWEGWLLSGVVWVAAAAAIEFGRMRWALGRGQKPVPDGDARRAADAD